LPLPCQKKASREIRLVAITALVLGRAQAVIEVVVAVSSQLLEDIGTQI
jgi:hypothetical protein